MPTKLGMTEPVISSIMLRTCRLLLSASDRSSVWFASSKNLGLLIATSWMKFWDDGFSGVISAAAKMLCLETVRKRANSEIMVGLSRTKSSLRSRELRVRSGEASAGLRTKDWYDIE